MIKILSLNTFEVNFEETWVTDKIHITILDLRRPKNLILHQEAFYIKLDFRYQIYKGKKNTHTFGTHDIFFSKHCW